MGLVEKVLEPNNIEKAYKQVVGNAGSAGIDGMSVYDLKAYMLEYWGATRQEIESGIYKPQAVLGAEIRKQNGGIRLLGIPTVIDRLIQQAIHQVLSPVFDVEFSEYSYGFRDHRNAQQAVLQAQRYINEGYQEILDLDLKSFFDTVNQDHLMILLARKVKDRTLLQLIRRYLQADLMLGGLSQQRHEGTPQGSPLSPLLSNIMLNELDKELEKRGIRFVRYADDCSMYLKSRRAVRRVRKSIGKFIETKLHLKVNQEKTSLCRPVNFFTLGYGFVSTYRAGERGKYNLRVSPEKLITLKQKVKEITRKTTPLSFDERIAKLKTLTTGWVNYFHYAHVKLKLEDFDGWVRNRLRYCIWHQWKKPNKRMRSLIRLGVPHGRAYSWSRSRMGGWAIAQSPILGTTITVERLQMRGYLSFSNYFRKAHRSVPTEVQLRFSFV
jgi:RNA-directed DNA polymerase